MPLRSRSSARGRRHWRRCQVVAAAAAAAAVLAACDAGHPGPGATTPTATASSPATVATGALPDCLAGVPVACYSPAQFRVAYGITPLLDRGIDGRGETVVLPEVAPPSGQPGSTDIRQDLALFDRRFGLPPVHLDVNTQLAGGSVSPYLAGNEEMGDAEMVHAVAPGAAIAIILLIQGNIDAEFAPMLRLAATLGGEVSLSIGKGEGCFTPAGASALDAVLQTAREQDVTVIAASGDNGAASIPCNGVTAPAPQKGVNLPASSPLVLAVGGTNLQASRTTGAYQDETAWNDPIPPAEERQLPADAEPATASNGGFSSLFPRPSYQAGIPGIGSARGVPDVAGDASLYTGMAVVQDVGGKTAIFPSDGTSAGAPFWAGIIALADQYAGRHLGFVNPAIYRIGRSRAYHRAFHDITTGDNTVTYPGGIVTGYRAAPGWDPVTGWGTPDAQALVPLLATGG
jgi:subtilase family serine protease